MEWLRHGVAALLVAYGISRLLRRAPLDRAEPRRSLLVHGLSGLIVSLAVYALRQDATALELPLAAQLGWFALDLARARAVRVPSG